MNLMAHQQEAIDHLLKWKVGALFMEAGTGKTRVAVTLANAVSCDMVLYIAPLRTISTVKEEVEKSGGMAHEVRYVGVESIGQSGRVFLDVLTDIDGKSVFCIVDESIKVKNFEAQRTRRVLEIGRHSDYRLILNGTPLTRNLLDLWSQMEFLSPKILSMSLNSFKNTFCRYTTITKYLLRSRRVTEYITGYENVDYLYSLIRNYVYECDLSLNIAIKTHDLPYRLSTGEKESYNEIKERYLNEEMMEMRGNNVFLEMTSEMQHSYCLAEDKFRVMDELFRTVRQEDCLIFCRFIASQEECRRRYKGALVLSFQKEAFGLNLQERNTIIYFDKVWDYALMVQSGRRVYRTGQFRDCEYYHLTGDVKLDDLIDKNISKKIDMTEYFKGKTKEQIYECI